MLSQALPARAADEKPAQPKSKVAIFSKHLQFLAGEELAKAVADIGFDGINITVRKGGHVEPERVRQDLPTLVGIVRKHGLEVPMITTGIEDTDSPFADDIFKTMAELGIHNYRWAGFRYVTGQPYAQQLEQLRPRVAKLAALNSRYQFCALYHTESGTGRVGSAILDLYILLKDFDPKAVGVNYDLGHAAEAGGGGSWINSFRILGPYVRGIAPKDYVWAKDSPAVAAAETLFHTFHWGPQWEPLGEGIVDFQQVFTVIADSGYSGLLELHFEYLLGGATDTSGRGVVDREAVYSGMKKDLKKLRGYLAQAHL
jgi:sugar phosphate isomerase/epimerase